jgi:hypothetical protein
VGCGEMSRIGPCGRHQGVRLGIGSARRPDFGDLLLDTGIRPESNTGSGDPSKVADGEVKAHLGDPGLRVRRSAPTEGSR